MQRWQSLAPAEGLGDAAAWPRWHRPHVHPFLEKHWPSVRGEGADAGQPVQVFVPLCGASLDLAWLAERSGVTAVVGVDLGGEAVFRRLPNFQQRREERPARADLCPGLHSVRCGRLRLYGGDLFHPELRRLEAGKSDLVWDRGSLVVINAADRPAYVALLHALCRPGHRALLEATVFPRGLHPGPPFCIDHDQVVSLYGGLYHVRLLEVFKDDERRLLYNLPELCYHYYLLTAK